MTTRYHWEDLAPGESLELGHYDVTREEIIEFATRYDPQPFHIDEEAARASLFGGLCASGWHTTAMAMRIVCDGYMLRAASLGSPGVEQIRFLKPVFPGDRLHVRLEVLESRPMASRPGVGLMRFRWVTTNQHGQTVMTLEGWGMLARREPAAAGPTARPGAAPPTGLPPSDRPSEDSSP
jgi:acyl dehydratase